jgi:hypothetical protein
MIGTDWCILVDSDGYIYRLWLDFSSGIFRFSKPAPSATWVPRHFFQKILYFQAHFRIAFFELFGLYLLFLLKVYLSIAKLFPSGQ